jgi:phosphate/sulfate permease
MRIGREVNVVKQVLQQIDLSWFAEAALLVFFAVFVVVSIKTLLSDRNKLQQHARDAITESEERK